MLQVVQNNRSGQITVEEVPAPNAVPGQVVVQNLHSLVSAGTEKAGVDFAKSSLLGKARSRPDLVQQVFKQVKNYGLLNTYRKVRDRLDEPQPLGYSSAGRVIAVGEGVTEIQPGMLVACAGAGFASHAEVISVPKNLVAIVPEGVDSKSASFATIGAIAMQGIRRAELTPGESVGVIGLGLIGQITVQILKAYGFPVMGIDISKARVEASQKFGMDLGVVIGSDNVSELAYSFSSGHGLDAVIITAATRDSKPVEMAGEIVRERGRVSAVGDVGMEIPRRVFYPKEIDFRISRSYGPGRYDESYEEYGLDYPLPWVRWTEQRNMQEFLRLTASGGINPTELVTHEFEISKAVNAYELVTGGKSTEPFLGVLIKYPAEVTTPSRVVSTASSASKKTGSGTLKIGLIGAGNFMSETLVLALKSVDNSTVIAVASARGLSAKDLAKKIGAQTASSDYGALISDSSIDLIVSATRHDLAAKIAIESLSANKAVHVEKPLATTLEALHQVAEAVKSSSAVLNVGFNRRYAPLISDIENYFSNRTTPLSMFYRVNAGWIDADHWVHDPVKGGGRIIGEVCHFIDLMQYLSGAKPTKVFATSLVPNGKTVLADDNAHIMVDFADGSRGTILYSALGAKNQPKEKLEVLGGGKSAELNDFKSLETWSGSSHDKKSGKLDKGHTQMLQALGNAVRNGSPSPIPFEQLAATTLATLAVVESIHTGQPIVLNNDSLEMSPAPSTGSS
ncbi:MAG: Gfo/Idh/MocA family oxidoreductase [Chloroflexi bacterium]|nr:Gfo/Idh/MocA family oxidoreductase [Chloroflexota bacterium]